MRFHREHYLIISIFLLAFIIRLVFVLKSSDIPEGDAYIYDRLAVSLSQGEGYVNTDGTAHSLYPPFYPFFLSVIYRFFGHSYTAVRIVQSIIGAFSCILIYLIGKRIYGFAIGAIAVGISLCYLPFIMSAKLLLTELVFTFLLLLVILYLLKIQEEPQRLKHCIMLGLVLGIALLTKSIMIFFPFFIIPLLIYLKKHYLDNLKSSIVLMSFFILSISPWIIRNYNIYHRFVPVSAHSGLGLYSSYRPAGGIFGMNAAGDDPVVIEANKISSPAARSDFLTKKTLEFIADNPREVLLLEFKKILYFWAPFDWEIVGGRWFNFVYVGMLPFFALGFIMAFKQLRKNYPILLPVIYFQIMTLIFYGSPRFRLPVEPYLFILATAGILRCWKHVFIWGEQND